MDGSGTHWRSIAAVSMVVLALAISIIPTAHADTSAVFPPNAVVFGRTYGEWLAEYFQWALSIPVQTNPSTDTTGMHCRVQQTRPIFFLGTTATPDPVTRECTAPSGRPLFIPFLGAGCSDVFPAPFFGSTDAERLACARAQTDFVVTSTLRATIDGVNVEGLQNFRFASPPFNFRQPAQNNLFNLPGVTRGRATFDAYSLMLGPLSRGKHTYHSEGAFSDGFSANLTVIITAAP